MGDVSGLNAAQKASVKAAWDVVAADLRGNGSNILIQLFLDFPNDQVLFPKFAGKNPNDLRGDAGLAEHAYKVMKALGDMIGTLDGDLAGLIKKQASNHIPRKVHGAQFRDMFTTILKCLPSVAGGKFNADAKSGFETLFNNIAKVFEDEQKRLG